MNITIAEWRNHFNQLSGTEEGEKHLAKLVPQVDGSFEDFWEIYDLGIFSPNIRVAATKKMLEIGNAESWADVNAELEINGADETTVELLAISKEMLSKSSYAGVPIHDPYLEGYEEDVV